MHFEAKEQPFMNGKFDLKILSTIGFGLILSSISINAFASNTQTFINNVSGAGNAYAGTTVVTDDASVQYYNPAGLTSIGQQLVVGGAIVTQRATFRGTTLLKEADLSQSGKATDLVIAGIPVIYYSLPLSCRIVTGFGISALGGAGQSFPDHSILRYTSTKTMIGIINAGPSLGYKLSDTISLGVGLDANYITTELNSMAPPIEPGAPDSKILNSADAVGYGWHAGILYAITPATKVGLAYRSRVNFHLGGESQYILNPGAPVKTEFTSSHFKFHTAFAPTTSLGASHDINRHWVIMGGIDYTQWSILKTTKVSNIATPLGPYNYQFPLNYHDTWRYSAAVNYRGIDRWILRMGGSYDQDASDHSILSADNVATTNVFLLGLGARYQFTKDISMDLGYSHYFFQKININYNSSQFQQVGTFAFTQANLYGVQLNVNI